MPELLCSSDAKIGLQGTVYFIGLLIGSVVWLRLKQTEEKESDVDCDHTHLNQIRTQSENQKDKASQDHPLATPVVSVNTISYMLLIESVSPQYRAFTGTAINLLDTLALVYLPMIY